MKTMTQEEVMEYFNISKSRLRTNYPSFAAFQLTRGIKITKRGRGDSALYDIEEVTPQDVDKSFFSSRKTTPIEDLPGEIWVPVFNNPDYQISNMGRVKNPQGGLNKGSTPNYQGYITVSLHDKNYRLHRLVLQSFDPRENFDELTVDHINGIRSDNRLVNLRWATNEENTFAMLANRADLHKELTRIIQKYGYEETKRLLESL